MDAFKTHEKVIADYRSYLKSFLSIQDERIKEAVHRAFTGDGFLPEPLVQFNPSYASGRSLSELSVHPDLPGIFGKYPLYKHQEEAINQGLQGNGFVVTSGTGSGKSLTYLATIFNEILKQGAQKKPGVKAILVYPMNALINSQEEEIKKFIDEYKGDYPITFRKYTGQEATEVREQIEREKPDIILTNYMMLELVMTRQGEAWMRKSIKENLRYLVFDELHTYRGRQGADVSMLIRRIQGYVGRPVSMIGTSATMMTGGTPAEKRNAVAKVASQILNADFKADSIIGETLKYCTQGLAPDSDKLRMAVQTGIDKNGSESDFTKHPLANWLEINIALKNNEGTWERGNPLTITQIAERMATVCELSAAVVKPVVIDLLRWTEQLNEANRTRIPRVSHLPFRFHQFISQTSTVYVTLDNRVTRDITIKPGRYIKSEDNKEKLLFPILFSRISGYDFLCVEKDVKNKKLAPRNPDETVKSMTQKDFKEQKATESDFAKGYIIPDEGEPFWEESYLDVVPESWKTPNGQAIRPYYEHHLPAPIYYDSEGHYSHEPEYPLRGYFIPAKLRIDPTAGTIYEDIKTGENTKLMRLGNEGRSTATTIITFSLIDALHENGIGQEDQKLLSFTDNRQDASLQAGHFNDFLATVRLRSGLYHTLVNNPGGLDINNIAERLLENLQLGEMHYAINVSQDPAFPDPNNLRAIRAYLLLRIFQDLKRGWRYTLPNLEQTALLRIEYNRLDQLAALDDRFEALPVFQQMDEDERKETLVQVLNYFRTNYALDHRMLVQDRAETENLIRNTLDSNKLWSLDSNEYIDAPRYMVAQNPGRTPKGIYTASIGPVSGLGKYLKRKFTEKGLETPDKDILVTTIYELCNLLERTHFLSRRDNIRGERTGSVGVTGYLLRTDSIRWLPGDEQTVPIDRTRTLQFREADNSPNSFFQNIYKHDFTQYSKEFEGREHTGQLDSDLRIQREERFRKGEISALFCSPTMELGIDIANLNIVHMRNVPPNPANYAQRSGRAGRSGQTALVFTYCSAFSPHDQNYFNAAPAMVAGAVAPPQIDLLNEELIRSHFHSYLLMEIALPELVKSLKELVEIEDLKTLKLKQSIVDKINDQIDKHSEKWIAEFRLYITGLEPDLQNAYWYTDQWLRNQASGFRESFDKALDRWRSLFWSAKRLIHHARMVMDDPTRKQASPEVREAKRQHQIGLKQVELLLNDSGTRGSSFSEFYVFRYLASEGFIPGYNFTRLPVRVFVGYKYEDRGEYISRPRFIALKEFGPNNLIYHNGNIFRITRMMLTDAEALQRKIRISKTSGYAFLDHDAEMANNDPITQQELIGDNTEYRTSVIEMAESEAIPQQRISCEEEERISTGFEIESYFNYPAGLQSTSRSVIMRNSQPMLNLIYGPATQLIQLNRKWRRSPEESFSIDQRTGKWLRKKDLEQQEIADNERKVLIFARDTADTLYIQPLENLGLTREQTVSLSFALKRGIEVMFQVEESEIGITIMGSKEAPNIMVYESAQGSLGILSQLAREPMRLKEMFRQAYQCMHFDPDTREETALGKTLPKASYQDLLSYYNQPNHDILNRHDIREVLEYMMDCEVSYTQGGNDREGQYSMLLEHYDKNSSTELKLLKYLYHNCLALPDRAQVNIPGYYINADFVYDTPSGQVLVFCDGSVHDQTDVQEDDAHKRQLLLSQGYDVVVWHYREPLEELVSRRKDIFRKVC